MTNEEEDYLVALMADLPNAPPPPSSPNPHRPISSSSTTTKTNPKFLYLLLRAAVMAVAISLFFLFIGIAAVVLIHICIAGRALTRGRGRRIPRTGRGGGDQASLAPCLGLSRKKLQQLPCFDYGFEFEPASDCAVCLEGFREGELCRVLPGCNHVFHVGCIDKWLVKVAVCPICRNCVEFKGFDVASVDALEAI